MTDTDFDQKMRELARRFLERTQKDVEALQSLTAEIAAGHDVWREIESTAHKIRGSGGLFGFKELGDAAAEIELLAAEQAPTAERAPKLSHLVEHLQRESRIALDHARTT